MPFFMFTKGDLLVFDSGVAVVLLDLAPNRTSWRVLIVRGNSDIAKGFETHMSIEMLRFASPVDGFVTVAESVPGSRPLPDPAAGGRAHTG